MKRIELGMLIGTDGDIAGKLMTLDPEVFATMQSMVPDDKQTLAFGFSVEMNAVIDSLRAGKQPPDSELLWAMSCGIAALPEWTPAEGETTGYLLRIDTKIDRAEVVRLSQSMKGIFDEPQGRAKLWLLTSLGVD